MNLSEETRNKLENLSKNELLRLIDLMDLGISQDLDKNELILIISTENESKIISALKKLKFVNN